MSATTPRFVSCGADKLYDAGSFPGTADEYEAVLSAPPAGEYICELFPSYRYHRPLDRHMLHGSKEFGDAVFSSRTLINQGRSGPSSGLFRIPYATVRDRVIYINKDGVFNVLYETFRPIDRESSSLGTQEHARQAKDGISDGNPVFFLQSTGCFNYGHWLADDLSRLAAFWKIREMHATDKIYVALCGHGEPIDTVKRNSIEEILFEDKNFEVVFFSRAEMYSFKNLYFASPTTYFGVLKSPDAFAELHVSAIRSLMNGQNESGQQCSTAVVAQGRRLFIDRGAARTRGLINGVEVFEALQSLGFERFTLENTSFREQRELFSQSSFVVGNMGAGMVNTVFCPPGATVFYLIPEGWDDHFFWDLAAVMSHQHYALYGPVKGASFFDGFTIDVETLKALVRAAGAGLRGFGVQTLRHTGSSHEASMISPDPGAPLISENAQPAPVETKADAVYRDWPSALHDAERQSVVSAEYSARIRAERKRLIEGD